MLGWFKRKSRVNKELASASSQRRANQQKSCADDMKALLKHAFELSTFLLEGGELPTLPRVHGSFPPFAVGILSSGEISDFNCLPNPEMPGKVRVFCLPDQLAMFGPGKEKSSPQLQKQAAETSAEPKTRSAEKPQGQEYQPPPIEAVGQGMKQYAGQGMIHAMALVDRVEMQHAPPGKATHAIRIQIEHVEAEPVTWYLPYKLEDQKLILWEESKESGKSFVFAE